MHFGHKESDQQQGKEINIVTALESFSTLLQYGINNAWRWCSSECCRKFDLKYKRWEKFRLFTAGRDVPINADRVNYSIVGVVDCELERKQITSRALMPKFDLFSHQYENRCLIVPFKTTGSNERWVVRDSTTFSHIDDKDFIIPSCTTAHHRTASAEENKHRRNKPKKCPIFRRPPFSSFACDRTLTSSFSLHSTGPLSTHEYIILRSVSVCHHVNNHKRIGEYWWWRWHTEHHIHVYSTRCRLPNRMNVGRCDDLSLEILISIIRVLCHLFSVRLCVHIGSSLDVYVRVLAPSRTEPKRPIVCQFMIIKLTVVECCQCWRRNTHWHTHTHQHDSRMMTIFIQTNCTYRYVCKFMSFSGAKTVAVDGCETKIERIFLDVVNG